MAEPTPVRFEMPASRDPQPAPAHNVAIKTHWADAWTTIDDLEAPEIVWSSSPALSTATLAWKYGRIKQPEGLTFEDVVKRTDRRAWVRISQNTEQDETGAWVTRQWFGLWDVVEDYQAGAVLIEDPTSDDDDSDDPGDTTPPRELATGEQLLHCYGVEKVLFDHVIRDAWWWDGATAQRTECPPVFNRGGKPNRTAAKHGPSYLFEPDIDNGKHWSTRDVVEYLLAYQVPIGTPTETPPFTITLDTSLDWLIWDRPQLTQNGATTHSLLNQLVNRRRMMTWRLVHNAGNFDFTVATATGIAVPIGLPGAPPVPANTSLKHYQVDRDPLTSIAVKDSGVDRVDRVVVRGAKRRSFCTLSDLDDGLVEGWDLGHRVEYEIGAEGAAYAGAGTKTRQEMDAEARARPHLSPAYSYFKIPLEWDGMTNSGQPNAQRVPVFTINGDEPIPIYYADLKVMQSGTYFSGDVGDLIVAGDRETAPLVVFRVPEGTETFERWVHVNGVADNAALEITNSADYARFSCNVFVPSDVDMHGIRLTVSGAPKHVIDGENFNGKSTDPAVGRWTYKNGMMLVSLVLEDQRYCEGIWPDTLPADQDVIREKVIEAGDGYKKDYVVPGTVIGVERDGTLKRSPGGYIPAETVDDDQNRLQAFAQLAASYYTRDHATIAMKTYRLRKPADVELGDFVVSIGNDDDDIEGGHTRDVNTVITQLVVRNPRGNGQQQPPPEMRINTSSSEVDALEMEPPATRAEAEAPRLRVTMKKHVVDTSKLPSTRMRRFYVDTNTGKSTELFAD